MKTVFYALFLIDEAGVQWFAGAYKDRKRAEEKGKASGKRYEVRAAEL